MTWEIVLGIIALVGFLGTIATWASKLAQAIATLNATIKTLQEAVSEMKKGNKESHTHIFEKLENHECRLIRLEDSQSFEEKK